MFQFKYFSHQTRIDIVEGFEGFNDNSPLGNCPHEIPSMTISPGFLSPDKCPWIILPCTTTTQTIAPPPWNSPQDNYHLDFCPPGNCPWMIPPWTTSLRTITPGIWPSRQLPRNDCPWVTASWTITPMKFPCISTIETLMNK